MSFVAISKCPLGHELRLPFHEKLDEATALAHAKASMGRLCVTCPITFDEGGVAHGTAVTITIAEDAPPAS